MPSIQTIRAALPRFNNDSELLEKKQTTGDIIKEILITHELYADQYDEIFQYFDTGEPYSTGQSIWDFLKYNLEYDAEPGDDQTVKSPAAILHPGERIDCKHYSLFAGGVLDAIKRNMGDTWTWCYRFANEGTDPYPGHVFVVIKDQGKEIWLDPCLSAFDGSKNYGYFIDKTPKAMALRRISGVSDNDVIPVRNIDPQTAMHSFLMMLCRNDFSLRTLLLGNPTVTYGVFKRWAEGNGLNFDKLIDGLNTQSAINGCINEN